MTNASNPSRRKGTAPTPAPAGSAGSLLEPFGDPHLDDGLPSDTQALGLSIV